MNPLRRLSVSHRLSAVFALLLVACIGATGWLQVRAGERQAQELIQRLSMGLAGHIAENASLMEADGPNPGAVKSLFGKLMDVNPSVEVYLLAPDGRIVAQDAPEGRLKRDRVDIAPVRALLAGQALPVFGDDPRSLTARKVFSAAPVALKGQPMGYVYVVLLGEDHEAIAQHLDADNALRRTLWSMSLLAGFSLLAGLAAFAWITRPLRRLTREVQRFEADGMRGEPGPPVPPAENRPIGESTGDDEISALRGAFDAMTLRISEQWRELSASDRQRREMIANISHDLRTPLTSLHGYLETLRLKADTLPEEDRRRYLDIALGQSRRVGRLAQALFELARLECAIVKPELESFSLAELVHDNVQKFELAAEAKQVRLATDIAPGLPEVSADVGMIERVLTNLLDNAIRHTPAGGWVEVRLRSGAGGIVVGVRDSGSGIPAAMRDDLFKRPPFQGGTRRASGGGLGLIIVQRMLQLHHCEIRLLPSQPAEGASFEFELAV